MVSLPVAIQSISLGDTHLGKFHAYMHSAFILTHEVAPQRCPAGQLIKEVVTPVLRTKGGPQNSTHTTKLSGLNCLANLNQLRTARAGARVG